MEVDVLSGPKKIIDLDSTPKEKWRIDPNAVHIFHGKLRKWEPVGCVLCIELDRDTHATFSDIDSDSGFYCMTHGELEEVHYKLVRTYKITIGGVTREGESELADSMLFPVSMGADERQKVVDRILDEVEGEVENEDGDDD